MVRWQYIAVTVAVGAGAFLLVKHLRGGAHHSDATQPAELHASVTPDGRVIDVRETVQRGIDLQPWQRAGYASREAWMAAMEPPPVALPEMRDASTDGTVATMFNRLRPRAGAGGGDGVMFRDTRGLGG